jgi:hypothetical protein
MPLFERGRMRRHELTRDAASAEINKSANYERSTHFARAARGCSGQDPHTPQDAPKRPESVAIHWELSKTITRVSWSRRAAN